MDRLDMSLDDIIKKEGRNSGGGGGKSGRGGSTNRRTQRQRRAPYQQPRVRTLGGGGYVAPAAGYMVGSYAGFSGGYQGGTQHVQNYGGGMGGGLRVVQAMQPLIPAPQVQQQMGVDQGFLKVSSKSNPKTVAGKIAHMTRQGESPTIMATGQYSINQCVKAIAISRNYLEEDGLDLNVQPEIRSGGESKSLTLHLSKMVKRGQRNGGVTQNLEADEDSQLKVAQKSNPGVVAGSIAMKIREGARVSLVSIGPGSVYVTVQALAIARRYLEDDGVDITFRPEFVHISMPDQETRSALKFNVLAQQI